MGLHTQTETQGSYKFLVILPGDVLIQKESVFVLQAI